MMKRRHLKEFIYDFPHPVNEANELRLIEVLSRVDGIARIDIGRTAAGTARILIVHSGKESDIRRVIDSMRDKLYR